MTKLECQEVFAQLSEYIDGELPGDLCAELSRHIDGCAPCIEFIESLRRAKALCREFKAGEKPAALDSAVREQMRLALRSCLANEA